MKHHFIPQAAILKNFTIEREKKGHLYEYKKTTKELRKRHTNQVAFVPDLYNIGPKAEKDYRLETTLGEIENEAGTIIDRIIAEHSLKNIALQDIDFLIYFFALSVYRSPKIADFVNSKCFPNSPALTKGLYYARLMRDASWEDFNQIKKYMDMILCEIPSKSFIYKYPKGYLILADRYAILYPKVVIDLTLSEVRMDKLDTIYCPISSEMCIVFKARNTPNPPCELTFFEDPQTLSSARLEYINNLTVRMADEYLYCEDEATLRRFIRKAPSLLSRHINWLRSSTALF